MNMEVRYKHFGEKLYEIFNSFCYGGSSNYLPNKNSYSEC